MTDASRTTAATSRPSELPDLQRFVFLSSSSRSVLAGTFGAQATARCAFYPTPVDVDDPSAGTEDASPSTFTGFAAIVKDAMSGEASWRASALHQNG
jgi:hypothetical protein